MSPGELDLMSVTDDPEEVVARMSRAAVRQARRPREDTDVAG